MKMLSLITAFILTLVTLTSCGTESRPETVIIQELIAYGGAQKNDQMQESLRELEKQNPKQGALWTAITDYWDYVNHSMEINIGKLPDDLPDDDRLALVVLGYQLDPDGSMQEELIERLKIALKCAEQYPNAYVICTGGGTSMRNQNVTEAGQMGEWLLANDFPKERLIIEDRSLTTSENALNTYAILQTDYPQIDSVAIVSSDYHIAWGALMFEAVFLRSAAETDAPEMHVVSNCACEYDNNYFSSTDMLRWQSAGLLQIAQTPVNETP